MHHLRPILSLLVLLPLACGDNSTADPTGDSSGGGGTTGEDTTGEDTPSTDTATTGEDTSTVDTATTTGGPDVAALYGCEEVEFMAYPLAGPLFDASKGGIQGPLQADYVLHTTQIYIKPGSEQTFGELAAQVSEEASKTEGLIAFTAGSDDGCGVARTMGIWTSEEAMYELVGSAVHVKAMGMTADLSYTGRVTHWSATADEANTFSWAVARAKLETIEPASY